MMRLPLSWTLGAAAVAAFAAWLAWGQFQRANAASEALRGYEEAARVTSRFLEAERQRMNDLILSLEELADVEDTNVCVDSPAIRALPDLLRRQRPDPR